MPLDNGLRTLCVAAAVAVFATLSFGQRVERAWGPQVNGLAANVMLDRRSYEIGEAIPLHIATVNLAETLPVFWGVRRLPEQGISISIRDSEGHLSEQRVDLHRRFFSGDTTPEPYRAGQPWILDVKLSGKQELPDRVGTYTLTVTWRPLMGLSEAEARPAGFSVVSNPVEFRIAKPRAQ